ncbi:MAG: PorP/SprF family type IX secretion system membrane protein [Flavobacteriia bacterium]|nr:PorP/SprF family type IX secretion system membrane protein [Flavobacteriia bacterium]
MIRFKMLLSGLAIILSSEVYSQQLPQYSQFLLNKALYNPAAMTINNQAEISLVGRWQMLGFGLEPKTVALIGQSKIQKKAKIIFNPASRISQEIVPIDKKRKIKLSHFVGGQILTDNYGAFRSTDFSGNYALKIPINNRWKVSLGASLGLSNHSFIPSRAVVLNSIDPLIPYVSGDDAYDAFSQGKLNQLSMNSAAGLALNSNNFFISLGARQIARDLLALGNSSPNFDRRMHWNLMAGYDFSIANGFNLQPAILIKKMEPSKLSYEFSALATINYIFWAGVNYHLGVSTGLMVGMEISDELKIGYSMVFTTNKINYFSNGGHEIMISYAF